MTDEQVGTTTASGARCVICGSAVEERTATFHKEPHGTLSYRECSSCGFIRVTATSQQHSPEPDIDAISRRLRTMIKMGAQILERSGLRVLVSASEGEVPAFDAPPAKAVARVSVVTSADEAQSDLSDRGDLDAPFDLVLAHEVIQRFVDPPKDFHALLSRVADNGLVVCSTNIYDGTDISTHLYPFTDGNCSYYTADSVAHIASEEKIYFDFRVPKMATSAAGPRKRYVLFSRSEAVLQNIALYFGGNTYAP